MLSGVRLCVKTAPITESCLSSEPRQYKEKTSKCYQYLLYISFKQTGFSLCGLGPFGKEEKMVPFGRSPGQFLSGQISVPFKPFSAKILLIQKNRGTEREKIKFYV